MSEESIQVEHLVMHDEVQHLIAYHTTKGDYARDCKATQIEIAAKKPIYISGNMHTKEDWLNSASEWEERRRYHRSRARYWKSKIGGRH